MCATACLLRPCWEMVIGVPKLGWVVVILSVGRGIGRGWVVGLFLWLLEFQQGIKDFVGGYVRIVIEVVVIEEFFVNEVSSYSVEVGSFCLVL